MARIVRESNFKKSYIPVILSAILLVFMIVVLVYVIFFFNNKNMINKSMHAEKMDDYTVNVNIATFKDDEVIGDDFNIDDAENIELSVTNTVVNGFTDKNISLANVSFKHVDSGFIVYRMKRYQEPFIALMNEKGQIKWLINLEDKKYANLAINDINIYKDDIYVTFTNDKQIIGQKISLKGKKSSKKIIFDNTEFNYTGNTIVNDSIIYYVVNNNFLKLYKSDLDFKLENGFKDFYNYNNSYINKQVYPIGISNEDGYAFLGLIVYTEKGNILLNVKIDYDKDIINSFEVDNKYSNFPDFYMINGSSFIYYNKNGIYSNNADVKDSSFISFASFNGGIKEDDEYAEDFTYNPGGLFFENNVEYVYLSNSEFGVIDEYKNNKLTKRIKFNTAENQILRIPAYIYEKNNKIIVLYVNESNSLYINEYKEKE